MDMFQAQRLVRELTDITVHPEKHDQTAWARSTAQDPTKTACGTVGCLAGNAVINAGHKLHWEHVGWGDHPEWVAHYIEPEQKGQPVTRLIREEARDLFGLTSDEAESLFDQDNTVPNMWSQAIEFADGYIDMFDVVNAYTQRAQARYTQGRKDERVAIAESLTKTEV